MKSKISVVINTLNEEANISDCIRSLQTFADEIVVCDMHSTDRTVEIAQYMGARVVIIDADFCDFGNLRHLAVQQAKYQWVFIIDADERMTRNLAEKLLQLVDENRVEVVYLSNLYWFFGDWVYYGGFFTNNWPRFFQRDVYLSHYKNIKEPIHRDLSVLAAVSNRIFLPRSYYLEHYAYPTIEKYINKTLGMYARVEGEELFRAGRKFSFLRLTGSPIKSFLVNFFLKQGFRDGIRGFILAVLYAGYRFTVWANVWLMEIQRNKESGLDHSINAKN